jgi:hypothetical protein
MPVLLPEGPAGGCAQAAVNRGAIGLKLRGQRRPGHRLLRHERRRKANGGKSYDATRNRTGSREFHSLARCTSRGRNIESNEEKRNATPDGCRTRQSVMICASSAKTRSVPPAGATFTPGGRSTQRGSGPSHAGRIMDGLLNTSSLHRVCAAAAALAG